MDARTILKKYPRLAAHLICESLGYFTPVAAARAIISYRKNEPFMCEWYSHIASCRGKGLFDRDEITKIGKDILKEAIQSRHRHKGYMADYRQARVVRNLVLNT